MKYLLWLFVPILLLGQVKTVTQTGVKRSLIRGDATTLTWTVTGDYSADSLLFIAVDNDSNAVLRLTTSGGLTASYSGQRTTITGTIYAATTENFISGGYLYDISSVTDSITLIMGLLTVIADVSNLEDTVLAPIPYYTVALDTPAANNNFIIGMDSNNVWYQKTLAQTRTILGIDTITGAANLPDSVVYDSQISDMVTKSTTQTITGQKNFTGTVKFGSDTLSSLTRNLITLGKHHPTLVTQGITINPYYGNSSNWNWDTYESISLNGYGDTIPVHVAYALGYNWDNANTSDVRSALVMENNYWINYSTPEQTRIYDTEIYFAWTDTNDIGTQIRPLSFNITRGTGNTQAGIAAEQFYITDKTRKNFIIIDTDDNLIALYDTMTLHYDFNNLSWLKQKGTAAVFNNAVELMRIDDNNNVSIAPDGYSPLIKLNKANVLAPVSEPDYDSGYVFLYNEYGDLKSKDGYGNVKVLSNDILPLDTTGLEIGKRYIDPNTGVVRQVLGTNLISNYDFTNWTNGYQPDGWTCSVPDTTNFYYENNSGQLHFIITNPSGQQVYHSGSTAGDYGYSFVVTQIVDTMRVSIGTSSFYITSVGTYVGQISYVSGVLASIGSYGVGAQEITVDNFRVWNLDGAKQSPIDGSDWSVFYTNGDGKKIDLGIGASGTVLKSTGTSSAPSWQSDLTGAGGSAYADSVTINGRHVPGDSLMSIDATAAIVLTYVDSNYVLTSETSGWDKISSDDLTTATNFGGDVSGNYNSIAVTDDSHNHVIGNVDALQDSLDDKQNRSELGTGAYATIANYSLTSHTHTEFFDTLSFSWGMGMGNSALDTITTGSLPDIKLPNNITITEITGYTNTGTVTFNIEIRGETTPNTAGTDIMASDLVADNDQQEQTSFSQATATRNQRLTPTISAVASDPTLFGITVRYIKTN